MARAGDPAGPLRSLRGLAALLVCSPVDANRTAWRDPLLRAQRLPHHFKVDGRSDRPETFLPAPPVPPDAHRVGLSCHNLADRLGLPPQLDHICGCTSLPALLSKFRERYRESRYRALLVAVGGGAVLSGVA